VKHFGIPKLQYISQCCFTYECWWGNS